MPARAPEGGGRAGGHQESRRLRRSQRHRSQAATTVLQMPPSMLSRLSRQKSGSVPLKRFVRLRVENQPVAK